MLYYLVNKNNTLFLSTGISQMISSSKCPSGIRALCGGFASRRGIRFFETAGHELAPRKAVEVFDLAECFGELNVFQADHLEAVEVLVAAVALE